MSIETTTFENHKPIFSSVILLCDTFVFLAVLSLPCAPARARRANTRLRRAQEERIRDAITAAGLILLSILGGVFLHSVVRRHGRQTKEKKSASEVTAAVGFPIMGTCITAKSERGTSCKKTVVTLNLILTHLDCDWGPKMRIARSQFAI